MSIRVQATVAGEPHLSPSQLRRLRRLLIDEHATQQARNVELQDPPDLEPGLAELLAIRCREALEEIERALLSMHDGTYGVCSTCQAAIPYERLSVLPAAECCVSCQASRDRVLR